MDNKLIIVSGYPATGKTTFSLKLAESLNIPFFNLDFIKCEISKNIENKNIEDSIRIGKSSFLVLMYILENIMKTNKPLIIENSFINDHENIINNLLKKYKYKALTYKFICDLKILHKRFIMRESSAERDKGNLLFGLWDDFQKFENDLKFINNFNIGDKIIKIDTSDFNNIDLENYIEIGKKYMI